MPELSREEFEKWADDWLARSEGDGGDAYPRCIAWEAWQASAAASGEALRWIPEDDFRTDFERTATYLCQLSITRDKEGHYIDANTLKAWICWRTALATLAAPDSRPSTEEK